MTASRYTLGELAPMDRPGHGPRRRKRHWFKTLLIVFLVFALAVGSCAVFGYMAIQKRSDRKLANNSTVLVRLSGQIPESPSSGVMRLLDPSGSQSVDALRKVLARAAEDPKVNSVAMVVHNIGAGFGTLETIREFMHGFRASKKPLNLLIEADEAGEKELYLAAAASKVYVSPHTSIRFDGLAAEVDFFRGTLDLVGVESQVIAFKEYKSALEPFVRKEMSAEMKTATESVLRSIWDHVLQEVAADRNLEVSALRDFAAQGYASAEMAQKVGLVDELGYRDQLQESPDAALITGEHYLQSISTSMSELKGTKEPVIALISATGEIVVDGGDPISGGDQLSGRKLAKHIAKAAKDERVSAILLRVNSPGGSMVGSDLVWREVVRAREVYNKPVVVSMGSVAASGGYWISMAANEIVADATTITGSIGVVFGRFELSTLFDKLGMTHDEVLMAPNANMNSPWQKLSPEQMELISGVIAQGYDAFVHKVAKGRKRSVQEIEAVAKGRIWTGQQAKARGLVDRLGGLQTAIEACKTHLELAPDAKVRVRNYPSDNPLRALAEEFGWFGGVFSWAKRLAGLGKGPQGLVELGAAPQSASSQIKAIAPQINIR